MERNVVCIDHNMSNVKTTINEAIHIIVNRLVHKSLENKAASNCLNCTVQDFNYQRLVQVHHYQKYEQFLL